jgi:acetate kinase
MNALTILVFNSGSSSLKFSFYRMESSFFDDSTNEKFTTETILNQMPQPETFPLSQFCVKDAFNKVVINEQISAISYTDATLHIIRYLAGHSTPMPEIIAHRVVHGGAGLVQHCFVNDKVIRQLEASIAFAPLHNQIALDIIEFTRKRFPKLPQVVCFDTTFHADMPDVAKVLPLAKVLQSKGIKRYGFHGLSCESVVFQLSKSLPEKLIVAHLGHGASITAIKNGQSIDTSMGLTPSGGVMMGTRSGDIDPSVLIYLMRTNNNGLAAMETLINHESGLLGVSGLSSDMRILHKAAQLNPDAKLAIDLFCYSVAKQIAAMTAALNGVDTIVFTGGIGENDALIRAEICTRLTFLGLSVDALNNQALIEDNKINYISDANSRIAVAVVKTHENAQIARHAWALLFHENQATLINENAILV